MGGGGGGGGGPFSPEGEPMKPMKNSKNAKKEEKYACMHLKWHFVLLNGMRDAPCTAFILNSQNYL